MQKLSVIIVNHNGKAFLGELFDSLLRQTVPADEVIMVDNASRDGSVDYVRRDYAWVGVIESPTNLGFAQGNNLGIETARGDYIALLNSDAVAGEQWLAESLKAFRRDAHIAAVVPKIYRASESSVIECAGAEFNNLGHNWTRGFNEQDRGQFDEAMEVAALTACAVVIRRSAIPAEPIFDPDFFMYTEEFDLSLRLRGRGHGIFYAPSAVVYHKGMKSVQAVSSDSRMFQQYHCNRNRVKILTKYYPARLLIRNLPMIWLSLFYWDTVFLFSSGPLKMFRAVASQIKYALKGLKERPSGRTISSAGWLPWMTRHRLRDILALRSGRKESELLLASERLRNAVRPRSGQV
jgi:GT2 family glycosyltransferase